MMARRMSLSDITQASRMDDAIDQESPDDILENDLYLQDLIKGWHGDQKINEHALSELPEEDFLPADFDYSSRHGGDSILRHGNSSEKSSRSIQRCDSIKQAELQLTKNLIPIAKHLIETYQPFSSYGEERICQLLLCKDNRVLRPKESAHQKSKASPEKRSSKLVKRSGKKRGPYKWRHKDGWTQKQQSGTVSQNREQMAKNPVQRFEEQNRVVSEIGISEVTKAEIQSMNAEVKSIQCASFCILIIASQIVFCWKPCLFKQKVLLPTHATLQHLTDSVKYTSTLTGTFRNEECKRNALPSEPAIGLHETKFSTVHHGAKNLSRTFWQGSGAAN